MATPALYARTPRLLAELALSRGDGRYVRRLAQLAKIGVLVLDDFCSPCPACLKPRICSRSSTKARSLLVASVLLGADTWIADFPPLSSVRPAAESVRV